MKGKSSVIIGVNGVGSGTRGNLSYNTTKSIVRSLQRAVMKHNFAFQYYDRGRSYRRCIV